MRSTALLLAALALASAAPVPAQARGGDDHVNIDIGSGCCDSPARWSHRHDTGGARIAITTDDGDVTLLLTDEVLAFQLSDRTLHRVRRELRDQEDEDDGALGAAIKSVVLGTVRSLVAHSVECPLDEVRDVRVENGQLAIVGDQGRHLFNHLRINDHDELGEFAPRDAAAFVREFQRVKGHSR